MSPVPSCTLMAGSMSERVPPAQMPVLAASIAVFRDGKVLLAQRGKAPALGLWSLPGGRIEPGEQLAEAALRELQEEVGLEAKMIGFVDHVEHIERDASGTVRAHAVIAVFVGEWSCGVPALSQEATDLCWVDPYDPGDLPMTRGLRGILSKAARITGDIKVSG